MTAFAHFKGTFKPFSRYFCRLLQNLADFIVAMSIVPALLE